MYIKDYRKPQSMLHGLFYFFKIPLSDGYDMGMGVGYVSDTRTQFRHADPLNFMIFEVKKAHIS